MLGAFAGTAAAADVTLYGVVDYGFLYNYTDHQKVDGTSEDANSFGLQSGVDAGSRWGIKGVEDLGNGLKVGFQLESGFNADDGTLSKYGSTKSQNRIFGRQASLSVYSDFGTLSFGRMGGLSATAGSYDIVYSIADAFDGGDNDVFGLAGASRYDNTVAYQSPKFAGLQATVMYSFKTDSNDKAADQFSDDEGDASSAKRYAGFALTGEYGPAQFVAAYELTKYGSGTTAATGTVVHRELDTDANVFFLGGNYDFGVAKVFAMGQYFNGLVESPTLDTLVTSGGYTTDGVKGYGFHLGTQVPVAGGLVTVGGYYSNFEQDGLKAGAEKKKGDYYGLAARYEYDLSKRTMLYVGAGYGVETRDKMADDKDDAQNQLVQAYLGLTHRF